MAKSSKSLLPDGVNPHDESAARRAAIECVNAAGFAISLAKSPGGVKPADILHALYDLERAQINAGLYYATGTTFIFGEDTPYRRAYQLVELIQKEISKAVDVVATQAESPVDGWSNLWDFYHQYCNGTDSLWALNRCGVAPKEVVGKKVADYIRGIIEHAARDTSWHFTAWPLVCKRLKELTQQKLSDAKLMHIVGALLNTPEQWANNLECEPCDPQTLPPFWEGEWPEFPLASVGDILRWLEATSANLPNMRNHPLAYREGAALELAQQTLRNARRLLDQFGEIDFPDCETEKLLNVHAAEHAIANLRRWLLCRNVEEPNGKKRGRKKATNENIQRDAVIAAAWEKSHGSGVCKADFVRDDNRVTSIKELNTILGRDRKRKSRADN